MNSTAAYQTDQLDSQEATIKVVRVTPHLAELWLKNNRVNRRLDMARVSKFAEAMRLGPTHRGGWKLNPEGMICFAHDGALLNGQHRLTAVTKARVPVEFYIATKVDPEMQIVMDKGRPRKVSDNLHMFHEIPRKYANKAAVLARHILTFEHGVWTTPNEADAVSVWESYNDGITWLYEQAEEIPWNRGAYYAAPLIYAYKYEPEMVKRFHHGLATCSPYSDVSCESTLFRNLNSPKLRTGGMKGFEMTLRVFNVLSAFAENRLIKHVYVSTVGYDRLKRRWGIVSTRQDGNTVCAWTNCPCLPVFKGLCWVHKNYGNLKSKSSGGDSSETE